MAISFTCVRCDRKYSVGDAMAGRRVTCKACGQEFNVPGGAVAARSAAIDDDDDDDGPPIAVAPPPRTVSPAAYLPPRTEPAPPRAVRATAPSRSRSGGTPDWLPSAIKGVVALGIIAAASGTVWYFVNHGVPTVADIQNNIQSIGVTDKAKQAVETAKEYTAVCNEMADNLAKLRDPESAKGLGPTMQALDIRILEVNRKLVSTLRTLNASEERHVKATAGGDVRLALGRIKSEVQRITSLPTKGNPSALVRNIVLLDREIAQWGDREGSLTGNTVGISGGNTLVVEATGLADEAARGAFGNKLRQLAGASGIMSTGGVAGGTRYQFESNSEAEAFSKQIGFGKVTKVSGNTISVVATLTDEDVAAERTRIATMKADRERMQKEADARKKADDERKLAEEVANTPPPLAIKVDPAAGPIDKALVDTRSREPHTVQEALKRLAWGVPEARKGRGRHGRRSPPRNEGHVDRQRGRQDPVRAESARGRTRGSWPSSTASM